MSNPPRAAMQAVRGAMQKNGCECSALGHALKAESSRTPKRPVMFRAGPLLLPKGSIAHLFHARVACWPGSSIAERHEKTKVLHQEERTSNNPVRRRRRREAQARLEVWVSPHRLMMRRQRQTQPVRESSMRLTIVASSASSGSSRLRNQPNSS